jgi:exopolyphosphatase / guanosine-5'-triphosphate,3'-diphosphate pyrophosphatase
MTPDAPDASDPKGTVTSRPQPKVVAALDLGSNSFHMVVARVGRDGRLQVVDRLKRTVRLAGGLDEAGNLNEAAQARALDALSHLGDRLRAMPTAAVRAVGTNTLRKARNSRSFLKEARVALGHDIDVISGHEEARLIYLGVTNDLDRARRRLVVDIGGGSTELIIGEGDTPMVLDSRYMGCVSWSMRHFADGRLTKRRFEKAVTDARLGLESTSRQYRDLGWERAFGSSGTINAIERVLMASGLGPNGMTPKALDSLRDYLIEAGDVSHIDLPEVSDRRRPVLAGGLAVLIGVFQALRIRHMTATKNALREGVLFDLLGRLTHNDVREQTVTRLAEQHRVDTDHADRIEACAVEIFEQVYDNWGLDPDADRAMLQWAARLHEVGIAVSYTTYHKHSAYLLKYGDLPGFSRQDQGVLAALVLSHRGKLDRERIAAYHSGPVRPVLRLAVVLRLARRLHRTRASIDIPTPAAVAAKDRLTLHFPEGFLDTRPLLREDLGEEQRIWQKAGLKLRFG